MSAAAAAVASGAVSSLKQISAWKVFGGVVKKFSHLSTETKTDMKFSVFLPPSVATNAAAAARVPAIYWLAGLTCTDDNFMHKAGAFRAAARANVALICPDTSPRGLNLPEEKDTSISGATWDFGEGAGFYVDATTSAFQQNYRMYSYVTQELPAVIAAADIGVDAVTRRSIFGHSMGGHGALISFLKNPGMYASVSAFAPICNPVDCDWGKKAFTGYLGAEDKEAWKNWDATHLAAAYSGPASELLIDQGLADDFFGKKQLLPENLAAAVAARAASASKLTLTHRSQEGYDHSYYFIQTFVDEHIDFHAKHLHASK